MAEAQYFKCDSEKSGELLKRYIEYAELALQKCQALSDINGAQKLERKCQSELKYLHSLSRRRGGYDDSHVRSSNLGHYLGLIHSAESLPGVSHILQAFRCPGRWEPLYADVVAGDGRIWVKVIARKAQALHLVWAGKGQYGDRDVMFQAGEYVTCAKEHPVNFVEPKIVFAFYNGVTADMAEATRNVGIDVLGNIVSVSENVESMLNKLDLSYTDSDVSDEECQDLNSPLTYENKANNLDGGVVCDKISEKTIPKTKTILRNDETCNLCEVRHDICCCNSGHTSKGTTSASTTSNTPQMNNTLDTIGGGYTEDRGGNPTTCTLSSKVSQTTGRSNYYNLKITDPQSSFQMPLLDEVCVLEENQLQKNPDAVSSPITDRENNTTICDKGDTYVAYITDGDLLMQPMVCYKTINSVLAELQDNTTESIRKLNLDVSAMINLVSAVTHGRCRFKFKELVLSEQASDERREESLPKIEPFLRGKELFACETAVQSFKSIVDLLGGVGEVVRADYLLKQITVVPDNPSFRTQCLPTTGKIKDRAKIIFGTGDSLKAVTLTANSAFIRAARNQGCLYSSHVIPARALTEKKEKTGEFLTEFKDTKYHGKCEYFTSVCPDIQQD